jgi:hypothetical protein
MEEQEIQLAKNWKQVCEITTGLARAFKSRQLYAANNPIRRTCLDTAVLALVDFLKENDTLTLSVSETQFIYHGKAVYSNPDRRESPVFRLYRDGIRTLSFHSGIDGEELGELLDALAEVNPESEETDADVVTQIWERELVHITYIAVDDCLDLEDSEADSSATSESSQVTRSAQGGESIRGVQSPEDSGPPLTYPAAAGPDEQRVGVATMTESLFTEQERMSIANVSLSEDELEEIGQRVLLEERQKPREKVSQIFLEILQGTWGSDVKTDVARGLGILCGDLLEHGNPAQATKIIRQMKELLSDETSLSKDLQETARKFLEARGREGELVRLEARLEAATLQQLEEYEIYLCELLPDAVPQVFGILARSRGRKTREMLCRVLSKLARENLDALADMASDPRWYLVRNLITIFRLMKDSRALVYLERLMYHEETRVRTEVVHCLAELGGQESEILLSRCLHDEEKAIRMLAVRKLSQSRAESAASSIADCIRDKSFIKRSTDEKREFFDALGRCATDDIVPFLAEFIVKRSFFHGAEIDEMRKFSAMALARMGTETAIELLEQAAQARNSKARKYCSEALRLRHLKSPAQGGSPDEKNTGRQSGKQRRAGE